MTDRMRGLFGAWASAVAAVLLGCGLLLLLGAPARMPVMNGAALIVGVAAAQILRLGRGVGPRLGDVALLAAALVLPATAIVGPQADGVARWLVVAGLTVQPGLILVPLIALGLASRPSSWRAGAVGVAALGTALQPDLGTAAMLVLGVAAAAAGTRAPAAVLALVLALAGGAVALARPVGLPPVPYVEGVLPATIAAGPLTALVALAGIAALFVPAWAGRSRGSGAVRATFVGVWLGGLAAAVLGPYPTPVIGFGGSAVLGYVLSVMLVVRAAVAEEARPAPERLP